MIKKGDIVTIKPDWQDKGDADYTFVARTDEHDGRFDMSALELANRRFWPVHLIASFMVEKTGQRLADTNGAITSA